LYAFFSFLFNDDEGCGPFVAEGFAVDSGCIVIHRKRPGSPAALQLAMLEVVV
jgi:hypothetical protein